MKAIVSIFSIFILCLLLQACEKPDCGCAPPLSTNLIGKWEWIKTIDENGGMTTPTTLGYGKSMSYGNSYKLNGNYLYLVEKDNPPMVLSQKNAFGKQKISGDTLILTSRFENKYVEFFLLKNANNGYPELIRTDLIDDYSKSFGNVRHYYKKIGIAEQP